MDNLFKNKNTNLAHSNSLPRTLVTVRTSLPGQLVQGSGSSLAVLALEKPLFGFHRFQRMVFFPAKLRR